MLHKCTKCRKWGIIFIFWIHNRNLKGFSCLPKVTQLTSCHDQRRPYWAVGIRLFASASGWKHYLACPTGHGMIPFLVPAWLTGTRLSLPRVPWKESLTLCWESRRQCVPIVSPGSYSGHSRSLTYRSPPPHPLCLVVHSMRSCICAHTQGLPPTLPTHSHEPQHLEDAVYSLTIQIPTKSWRKGGKWLGKEH